MSAKVVGKRMDPAPYSSSKASMLSSIMLREASRLVVGGAVGAWLLEDM